MKLTGAFLCLVIGFAAVKAFSISGRAYIDTSRPISGSSLSFSGIPGLNVFGNLFGARRTTSYTTKNPNRPSSSTQSPSTSGTSTQSSSSSGSSTQGPSSTGSSTQSSSSSGTSTQGPSSTGSSTQGPSSTGSSTQGPSSSGSSTQSSSSSGTSTQGPSSSSTSGQGSSTSGSSTGQSTTSRNAAMPLKIPNMMNIFKVPSADSFFSSNSIPTIPTIPGMSNLLENSAIPGVDEALNEAREHVTQALSLGANFEISLDQAIQDALASNDPSAALRTLVQAVLDAYVTVAANCPLIVVGLRVLQEGIRLAVEVARSAENIIFGTTTVSTTTVTSTT